MSDSPFKLAVQLWSFRHQLRESPEEVLAFLGRLGVKAIELAGTAEVPPKHFKRLCDEHGFAIVGLHEPCLFNGQLDELVKEAIDHCHLFNTHSVTVMMDPRRPRTADNVAQYADLCNKAGSYLADSSIQLSYHCYDFDLNPLDGETSQRSAVDVLMANTDAEFLSLELDTYFAEKAKVSLDEIVEKHGPRVSPLIHMNDISGDGGQAIIGDGGIGWSNVIRILSQIPVEYLIVEHNCPDPEEWVTKSWRNLTSIIST